MRHRVAGRRLSRTSEHRVALRRNLAQSLIEHETISTTIQKAKEVKPFVEKLITLAKKGQLQHRRRAIALLGNRDIFAYEDGEPVRKGTVIAKLFSELGPRYLDRPGGYTRIIRLSLRRLGDNGELVLLQLLGEDEPVKKEKKRSTKRRARKKRKEFPSLRKRPRSRRIRRIPLPRRPRNRPGAGKRSRKKRRRRKSSDAEGYGEAASMDGCVFCKMVKGEIPVARVYEDEAVLAFKEHCARIHECDPAVLARVASSLGKIAGAVAQAMGADGYNVLSNGQLVEHLHFHVIPRKANDGVFTQWPSFEYEPGRLEELAEEIRKNLK